MKKIEDFTFVVTIFIGPLLYAMLTYLNGNYTRFIATPYWTIIKLINVGFVLYFFIIGILKASKVSKKILLNLFLLFVLIILNIIVPVIKNGYLDSLLLQDILIFFSRGFPMFLVGILIVKKNNINKLNDYILYTTIFVSIALIISFFSDTYRIGNSTAFGGINYQTTSYTSSLMLGLNLYYAFFYQGRVKIFPQSKIFSKLLHVLVALLLFFSAVQSGGRGGIMSILAYLIFTFIFLLLERRFAELLISITIIGISLSIFLPVLQNTDYINGATRAFSLFFNNDNLALADVGRSTIYETTIEHIKNSPLFGNGFGTYYSVFGTYPHNIMLLILFEGGILLLALFVIVFINTFMRILYLMKNNNNYILIIYITLNNFVMLLFSSTYLRDDLIWLFFGLGLGIFARKDLIIEYNKLM